MPCPESDNPLVDRAGCQLLQVSIVQDPYGLDWVLVTIFPELDFMEDIFTANAEALRRVESSKADTEETIDNALILSLGIACGWILVSLAMAWLAAKTLSSPLGTLSSDIKRLAFLEFGHPEDARPSFIREVWLRSCDLVLMLLAVDQQHATSICKPQRCHCLLLQICPRISGATNCQWG